MILLGTKPQRFISLIKSRFAARLSRRDCRISSRTTPCWSTARQSQYDRPAIFTTTSSRCQTSPGRGCRCRRTWAIRGAELDAPAPDCLIRNVYATLQHQLLDLAQAQVEPDVEPDNMSDDLRWKPVALIADFLCLHRHRLSPDQ